MVWEDILRREGTRKHSKRLSTLGAASTTENDTRCGKKTDSLGLKASEESISLKEQWFKEGHFRRSVCASSSVRGLISKLEL